MPIPVLVSQPTRETYHGLEDAAQTWNDGDFVTLDATSGETRLFVYDSDTKILGLAQKDATGVTSSDAPVTVIHPSDKIALDTYGTILSTAKDASAFIPGKLYELISVGSGDSLRWYANFDGTHGSGTACLICEGEVQGSLRDKLDGSTRYRALFRLLDSVLLQHVGQ